MTQESDPPATEASDTFPPKSADLALIDENLTTELHTIIRLALEKFGVDEAAQARAFEKSRNLQKPEPASGITMRLTWGLSNLIAEWSRTPPYIDRDGQPRILKIRGKSGSFKSLVERFLPGSSLDDVIDLARRSAEVELLSKGRIALLGSVLVQTTASRQTLLAHAIRHVDQLLQTVIYNANLPQGMERDSNSRMERMVLGVIRKARLDDFMTAFRPQIYDLMLQVDSAVEQRAPQSPTELQDSTAVAVGVYVSEESDWERVGIDPLTVLPREP